MSADAGIVHIIGIGDDGPAGLSPRARALIERAELLCGGGRHLAFFAAHPAEKVVLRRRPAEVADLMAERRARQRCVVLASGDPLFYGVAKALLARLPREAVEVLPAVSSMQLAFARAKESWDDAVLVSVHGRPLARLLDQIGEAKKVGIFTDEVNTPARIAAALLERGEAGWRACVCENLCGADERVTECDLAGLVGREFAPLNCLLLVRKPYAPPAAAGGARRWTFGIPDAEFFQRQPRRGLITKAEVRVIALAGLALGETDTVWDVGAGSGSVAIEAALLARFGRVYAVEKNREDVDLVRKNIEKFAAANVTAIHGAAPAALAGIADDPDAVFVGGSGGELGAILAECRRRLRPGGRIVVAAATIETLTGAATALSAAGLRPEITLVSIARSEAILDLTRLAAQNPIFLIAARAPGVPEGR